MRFFIFSIGVLQGSCGIVYDKIRQLITLLMGHLTPTTNSPQKCWDNSLYIPYHPKRQLATGLWFTIIGSSTVDNLYKNILFIKKYKAPFICIDKSR